MNVLFTGASSFTGFWFVKELSRAGHRVIALIRRPLESYEGLRRKRLELLRDFCELKTAGPFGSSSFMEQVEAESSIQLLCHHAAEVNDYRSAQFDTIAALEKNTMNLSQLLRLLRRQGCDRLLLTGTVFEPNEGQGSSPLRAFSPYGLSKSLTAEYCRYYCLMEGVSFSKFVIANPFGPYEEPRFTDYLLRCWRAGERPAVKTPDYVRDNIPVSLLARAYVWQVENRVERLCPSGYVESQGSFAQRFGREIGARLGIGGQVDLAPQKDFSEPLERYGLDRQGAWQTGWNSAAAWDELASYYLQRT